MRITSKASGKVWYCRTHDFSAMGVATRAALHSTGFDVTANADEGSAELEAVANGIAPLPVRVFITQAAR